MSHHLKNLRKLKRQALAHYHHHSKLRQVLEYTWEEEKRYWPLVLGILLVASGVLMWGYKNDFLSRHELRPAAPTVYTNGFEQGAMVSQNLGKTGGIVSIQDQNTPLSFEGLGDSLVTSNQLSKTGGAKDITTGLLQKSLLSTFYLGQNPHSGQSLLENDTQLLNEMENVLEVDLFQYLNQSANRADALQNYVNLMITVQKRAQERQSELTGTLSFLETNIEAQEQTLSTREENFFGQLSKFEGQAAEGELEEFVEEQKQQAENKAKLGVYESLESYYAYYNPLLAARIDVVQANRDALIAGVKVVNLPGIEELGLIVEED